ncbi:MAG: hypothetical protein O6766_02475 [Gammaproteobacteria bacterium]|nr:hypothetical protein [Gammaproteobacteria bacterium]
MPDFLHYSTVLLIFSPIFVLGLRRSVAAALISASVLSALAFIPIYEVSTVLRLKGLFADLSLTTLTLLVVWPVLRLQKISLNNPDSAGLCTIVLLLAVTLYPMALGVGAYDPYALGFRPWALLTVIAALGVLATLRGYLVSKTIVVVVLIGYWLRVLDSQNLWDYLIDPILGIFAIIYLLRYLLRNGKLQRSVDTSRSA